MERGTRDLLAAAEGKDTTRGGVDSDDDIFGFRQRAVSEDALRELRRQNEDNMRVAIATLHRGGVPAASGLPAVYGAHRVGQGLPVRRPARRKQPGLPRPQTPSEVRDAAQREMSEREKAEPSQGRQPQHRPPGLQQQQQQSKKSGRLSSTANGGGGGDGGVGERPPMHDESNALFHMLDWQKECRVRGIDTTDILKLQPRAMYDKEFRDAERALQRHNRILREYTTAAATASDNGVNHDDDDAQHSDGMRDEVSVAPEPSVISNISSTPSQTRARREHRLQRLLEEARSLRHKSLAIVHKGGVDMVNLPASMEVISPAGRNVLQVLHSLLETGLSDEMGLVDSSATGGAVDGRAARNSALRKILIEMQAQYLSAQKMQVGKKRAYDDARLLPSHNRTKREKLWQEQVKMYSSWDEGSSDHAPPRKKKDALHKKTMMLLQASERWVHAGDEDADENIDLEEKLREIQRRNKRMARMAIRTQQRGPVRFVLYDSEESEDDLYEARRYHQKGRGRKKRQMGKPYRQSQQMAQGVQQRGYAPDATTEAEEDEAVMSAGGFKDYMPQDRRRLREIAAMRKARLRGDKAPTSGMGWVDDILPSPTEDEDGQQGDTSVTFMKGKLAQQVSEPMSRLKGPALDKSKGLGSMEQKLMKMRADATLAASGGFSIGQTQEKIYNEVHKIRKLISGEVRAIFTEISLARDKLREAKDSQEPQHRDLLTQEAQRLLMDAEMRANALRERYRQNPDMNLEFMPEYLRNFLMAGVSAQTMFDRGRLEAVQAKAERLQFEERQREERAAASERRRKRQGVVEEEEHEFSDGGMPILTVQEKLLLKELLNEAKQLNVLIQRVHDKSALTTETEEYDAMEAADNAMEAANFMESAMQMHRALRRKLKSIKAKKLRPILPLHLKNLLTLTMPLLDMWSEGFTEAAVCEAMQGLSLIDSKIKAAKNCLIKFEQGQELTQDEEEQARMLLEGALVDAVGVRERARASMLDVDIGGAGLSIKRFPKHVANLLVSDESVIVLWEKGLIDKQICRWLEKMVEINLTMAESQKHEYKAMMLGETPKGLAELAHVDTLQHEADTELQYLRLEIDQAIACGLQRSRLPPHLLNILKDRRSATLLMRLGKTDPVMALFEQHAHRMLKSRKQSREMEKRAQKLLDAENRKAAMEAAGGQGEAALREMLQLRAKVLIGLSSLHSLSSLYLFYLHWNGVF